MLKFRGVSPSDNERQRFSLPGKLTEFSESIHIWQASWSDVNLVEIKMLLKICSPSSTKNREDKRGWPLTWSWVTKDRKDLGYCIKRCTEVLGLRRNPGKTERTSSHQEKICEPSSKSRSSMWNSSLLVLKETPGGVSVVAQRAMEWAAYWVLNTAIILKKEFNSLLPLTHPQTQRPSYINSLFWWNL